MNTHWNFPMMRILKYQFKTLGNFQGQQYKFPIWNQNLRQISKIAVMKPLEFSYDQNKELSIFHPRKIPRVNISAKYRKELSRNPWNFPMIKIRNYPFFTLGKFPGSTSELNIEKSCHETLGIFLIIKIRKSSFFTLGKFPGSTSELNIQKSCHETLGFFL